LAIEEPRLLHCGIDVANHSLLILFGKTIFGEDRLMVLSYHRSFQQGLVGKYAKVARKLPSNGSILEIGCHTGYFSRALMDCGYQVLGIEKDEEAAKGYR